MFRKTAKRVLGALLGIVMALMVVTPAYATQEGTLDGGSITIKDAIEGQTYNAYQILYVEGHAGWGENAPISYKANSAWTDWLEDQTSFVSIDDAGYVTWVDGANVEQFAKLALAYAKDNSLSADASDAAEGGSVSFTNLKLGYYLVDTPAGTLCRLDTTTPSMTVNEKNVLPTVEKLVQEDSDNSWGASNTAQIGDTVNFKTTVHAKKGAQGYVLHDAMDNGLTLNASSIKVTANDVELANECYSVATGSSVDDGCDFEITFTQDYLDTIIVDTDIVVEYSALLNGDAVISTETNDNETYLAYGNNSALKTTMATTNTSTYSFDLVKTDTNNNLLTGAKFELYTAQTDGTLVNLIKNDDGTYRLATAAEASADDFTSAVIEAGKATVKGLDANTTYWLQETDAPDGYNRLNGRVEVKIEAANLSTNMSGETWENGDGGVHVVNKTGQELPSTGGMGTTALYVVGGALVIGAGITLVVRRRMSAEA